MRPQALFGRSEGQQHKQKASLGTPHGSLRLLLDSASVMQWERWSKSQLFYGKTQDPNCRLCPIKEVLTPLHTCVDLVAPGIPYEILTSQGSQQIPAIF